MYKQDISGPFIRVSHPVKGRIPFAKNKRAEDLEEHEKTLYYERMMLVYRLEGISKEVNGQCLNLVVGGIKSYSQDNLSKRSDSGQSLKIFIGFQVKVCSNLCIWTDGDCQELKVSSLDHIKLSMKELLKGYNYNDMIPKG